MENSVGLIDKNKAVLLIIDYQESLMSLIYENEAIIANANKLVKGAEILGVATLVTEQYPKGLGHTCKEIELSPDQEIIEKISFSCILSDKVTAALKNLGTKTLILAGIEAHICVLKTALDAKAAGYEVHVVADAISSRTEANRRAAIRRMEQAGIFIISTEMLLFQLMDEAGSSSFKQISQLVK